MYSSKLSVQWEILKFFQKFTGRKNNARTLLIFYILPLSWKKFKKQATYLSAYNCPTDPNYLFVFKWRQF